MDGSPHPARWSRALAVASDAGWLCVALALSGALALAWLFVRSHAGRDDIGGRDAIATAAVVLAVPPAWFAWYALSMIEGRSPGQGRTGLQVQGTAARRGVRAALHPLALPAWTWLALVGAAAGSAYLALAMLILACVVALAGLISLARWVAVPARPGLHDLLAGTRLVRATRQP